jgi:hypothetical protein
MNGVRALDVLLRSLHDATATRDPAPVAAATRAAPVADALRESLRRGPPARTATPSALPQAPIEGHANHAGAVASRDDRGVVDERPFAPPRNAQGTHASTFSSPGASARAAVGEASTSLDLSPTGRLLQAALASTASGPVAGEDTAPPLVPGPPVPAALALRLADAIAQSGIFYESHLARWVRDGHPPDVLATEPQARWEIERSADLRGQASASPDGMPAGALPLLQQQLEALDARSVTWAGLLWPGQPAKLTIAGDDCGARPDVPDERADLHWQTRIELTLPMLGRVVVTLAFHHDSVQVRITAADRATAQRLQDERPSLETALGGRALALARFEVADNHAD